MSTDTTSLNLLESRTSARAALRFNEGTDITTAAWVLAHALDVDEAQDALDEMKEHVGHLEGILGQLIDKADAHMRAVALAGEGE